jgi:hypothetical protein
MGGASPVELERALASGTLMHLPHVSERTVQFLSRISRELQPATIHLGTDRPRIADTIRELLTKRGSTRSTPQQADPRPFVSVIVHFRNENHDELKAIAASLRDQQYSRLELVVTADVSARGLRQTAAALEGNVYAHVFDETVLLTVAWNRAIRESFSELLLFLEPGDRLAPGAIDDLVRNCSQNAGAGYVVGGIGRSGQRRQPLHGALVRKQAFRTVGLFETDGLLEPALLRRWMDRAVRSGLSEVHLDRVSLEATSLSAIPAIAIGKTALRTLKENVERRRQLSQP